jgi:hypothetical protein
MAVEYYRSVHGCYPPAYLADEDGQPMHSWRVLVLPGLGHQDVYDAYRFDEPWDSPHNRELMSEVTEFSSPHGNDSPRKPGHTAFVALVGPNTMWPGATGRKPNEVRDGMSKTLLLVEAPGRDIPWMEPRDLTLEALTASYREQGGAGLICPHRSQRLFGYSRFGNVAFANGRVAVVSESVPLEVLAPLLSVDGGEELPEEQPAEVLYRGEPIWHPDWRPLIALAVFGMLTLVPGYRLPAHFRKCRQQVGDPERIEEGNLSKR